MKKKKTFEGRKRECLDAVVKVNKEDELIIDFYGILPSKKNGRINFRGMSLPSANYTHWHNTVYDILKNTKWNYTAFPCSITIESIIGDKTRSDVDNKSQSIMDLLTDLGVIEDDNRYIISELHAKHIGYVKNFYRTRLIMKPLSYITIDDKTDYKGKDLKQYFN